MDRQTAAGFPHGRRLLHTKPSGFIELAEPRHHALPRPCGSPMRFHERPIRCASSIFLLEILSDKHSRGWYRRISHPPDTEFSLHHVSTSQTRTFSNSRFKNTPIYFPAVTDFFTSGEDGLAHVFNLGLNLGHTKGSGGCFSYPKRRAAQRGDSSQGTKG